MSLSIVDCVERRNARIFEDIWKTLKMMWDLLHFYVSFGLTIQAFLNSIL